MKDRCTTYKENVFAKLIKKDIIMKQNYISPIVSTSKIESAGMMQTGSPVYYITGTHTPLEWATAGANADDGV